MAGLYDDLLEEETISTPPPLGQTAPATGLYDDILQTIDYENIGKEKRQYQPWEVLPEMARNWGPDAVNVMQGMWKTVTQPHESIPAAGRIIGGAGINSVGVLRPEIKELMLKSNPRLQEMIDAANAVGGHYAERYGSIDAIIRTAIEHPAEFGMDASTLLAPAGAPIRAGARALGVADGVVNTAANVANPTRFVETPAQMAGNALRGVVNRFDPQGQLMLGAVEGQESQVLNQLRAAREIVPGSTPTAAQAVATMPNTPTRFQALGKAAEKRLPTEATNIKDAQNAARLAQIQTVGRTPADLNAAVAARDAASAANYNAAYPVVSTADDALMELMNRPSMDKVMARARELSAERNEPFEVRPHTPAHQIPDPYGQALPPIDVPEVMPQWRGRQLHMVKQAFDDLIANPERFGIGASEVAAIRGTRGEFINWFENSNPAYRTARQEHAAASRPIDQMRIGQYLERVLQNPTLGEDTATLRADAFSNATRDAVVKNTHISRATGRQMYDNLDEILTPQQMAAVQSVQDDLARAKLTETQANAASQYTNHLNNAAPPAQAPGLLNVHTTVFNALSRLLTGHVSDRVAGNVANAMMTPEGAARILEQAINNRNRLDNLSRFPQGYAETVRAINRAPSVYNALEAERQNRK